MYLLDQSFSTLAAHWNHLGNFKNYRCLGLTELPSEGCGLGRLSLKTSPGDSNMQSSMTTMIN